MLVLTRGAGESILLVLPGGGIVVMKVDSVHRGQVKLSLDAPDDVQILRTELTGKTGDGLDRSDPSRRAAEYGEDSGS